LKWIIGVTLFAFVALPVVGEDKTLGDAASYVRPIDFNGLESRLKALPARQGKMIKLYMEAAQRDVLEITDGCYPVKGAHEHYRNLAERAKGAAVLSSFEGYWPEELRKRCREKAREFVGEVALDHRKKPNLGRPWQVAFWVAEAGIAAWFIWDDLDADLQNAVAEMVIYQADRFVGTKPNMGYKGNTQAETVSWNSSVLSLAVNMMPDHPHNKQWDEAAKRYVYNTFAAPQDAKDESIGDDGKAVKDWIVGANIYEDFALENHNRFHMGYLYAGYWFHIKGAALYWLTGRSLPRAFGHHARDVYDRLMLRCMDHDGFVVYVSDNDWRRYHIWAMSCSLHAYMALMEGHRLAAALEERALNKAMDNWRTMPADFSYDNPYGCGKAITTVIADTVLLHITCPQPRPTPLSDAAVQKGRQGTFELKTAKLLTHYSKASSFRSYFWGKGPSPVRYVSPRDDSTLLLPLGLNYRGSIGGKPVLEKGKAYWNKGEDWFWVIQQQGSNGAAEAFVSLPDEMVVYLERIDAASLAEAKTIDNAIAVEKSFRPLTIHFADGQATFIPRQAGWLPAGKNGSIKSSWVNIQDRIGYIFKSQDPGLIPEIKLPEAGKRDPLGVHFPVKGGEDRQILMVTLPNLSHTQTAELVADVELFSYDRVVVCRIKGYTIVVNFSMTRGQVPLSKEGDRIAIDPWQVNVYQSQKKLF
jgi:hypothetical protein